MARILYLVETPGQFVELERVAMLVARERPARQLFVVYDCATMTAHILERIKSLGGVCLTGGVPQQEARSRMLSFVPSQLRAILRFARDTLRPLILFMVYRHLLRTNAIDLVLVTEDNVGGRSRVLVETATRLGIQVLLIPYTIPNPDEAAAALCQRILVRPWRLDQRLVTALRSSWARQTKGLQLLRLPVGQALAYEVGHLAPTDPWIDNKGPATIAIESEAMLRHYRALGVPDRQLVKTGSMSDIVLAAVMRERENKQAELRRRFALSDRPLLLCALPPDQLTTGIAVSEFSDYQSLVAGWASALAAVAGQFAILVRPHPRINDAHLKAIRDTDLAISWDDTATLIPLCDLYVASISATIRWAIACGKPVINYDVYRYGLADYADVSGVIPAANLAEFKSALAHIANSPERLAALSAAQARVAPDWGLLDGRSDQRMLSLLDRMLART